MKRFTDVQEMAQFIQAKCTKGCMANIFLSADGCSTDQQFKLKLATYQDFTNLLSLLTAFSELGGLTIEVYPRIDNELTEEYMDDAIALAGSAFWDSIANSYWTAISGDYMFTSIEEVCKPLVEHWVECNVLTGTPVEHIELNLDCWRFTVKGGRKCYISDNFVVRNEEHFITVTSEEVVIHRDFFGSTEFYDNVEAKHSVVDADVQDVNNVVAKLLDMCGEEISICHMLGDIDNLVKVLQD